MMILRVARTEDLNTLISWIKDKEACKLWAGPVVRFPLTLEGLTQDIAFSAKNTFAMVNDVGELFGLGQLLEKGNDRIHMARLIVSPPQRAKGFGELLCRLLIDAGTKRFGIVYFTLNVYSDNKTAVKLYQKLGFIPKAGPPNSNTDENVIHMVLRSDRTTKLT